MAQLPMSAAQYLPLPPAMFAHACDTVSKHVSQLPFLRSGVTVNGELIGVAMECLNAGPKKTLALSTPQDSMEDGLDRCIDQRLHIPGKPVAVVIADVLCSAGIAEPVTIMDRHIHSQRRGIRLTKPWTWHIASVLAPSLSFGWSSGNDSSLLWMDMCPVCRTGILNRVTGKQLFGIPHTDFYCECTHCGAKFIPVGPAFRLVSIATIRDPLWKKHVNETHTAQEWSALTRRTGPGGSPDQDPGAKHPSARVIPKITGALTMLSNGSLAVPITGKTRYFRPLSLLFSGGIKEGTFARVQKTLADLLRKPAFMHLQTPVDAKYSRYLPMKCGIFLSQLKERHDMFYREFLNPYGDEKYGSFRVVESGETEKKGILLIVVNREICQAFDCPDSFRSLVNEHFGRIGPEDCLLSGDGLRCRINALVCTNKKEVGLYIHPVEAEDERRSILDVLTGTLPPDERGKLPGT